MIRKGFVGIAGAVVVAAVLAQASTSAQSSSAPKAPAKAADQKAAPAPKTANPDAKTPAAAKPAAGDMKADVKSPPAPRGEVPAKTPTSQPATGAADEPKTSAETLLTVHLPKKIMADGKPLAAGSYTLRVTSDMASKVVGQTQSEQRWVEFMQGKEVKGREVAMVLTNSEAKTIAKMGLPAPGTAKVETLIGNDYMRVWINKGGTNYLVYLGG